MLYMAWKGVGDDPGIYFSSSTDGTNWTGSQKIPGVGTASGPSLAMFESQLFMTWRGIHGMFGSLDSVKGLLVSGVNELLELLVNFVGPELGVPPDTIKALLPKVEPYIDAEVYKLASSILGGNDPGIYWSSSSDGGTWFPQAKVPNVGNETRPSITVFNNALYMAWRGAGDDKGIYWTHFDGKTWADQQLVQGASTSYTPSLTSFKGLLYMVWKGVNGDPGIYWANSDGNVWTPPSKIPNVGCGVGTTLITFNDQLYMTWNGSGDPGIWFSTSDGKTWANQKRIPNVGTSSAPSIVTLTPVIRQI